MSAVTEQQMLSFRKAMIEEEKSPATVQKYLHDVRAFVAWLGDEPPERRVMLAYKAHLCETHAPVGVNAALASLNRFVAFLGRSDLKVKNLKIQRQLFIPEEKELTKAEYRRLLAVAKGRKDERLYLLMQTICATGIRVSELKYITVEAARCGEASIDAKGKCRQVFLPKALCRVLLLYVRQKQIKSGAVFVTKSGKPLDRSNIWSDMKKLCREAGVSDKKVFPHNLRHLFARTYYTTSKDVVRLADILGHTNVNTTRIYTAESGKTYRRQLDRLGLLFCETGQNKTPHN